MPVYRVANPNGGGGFMNADWVVPLYSEANSAEYVTDPATRDALLAQGWRDDGIAFYTVPDTTASATKTVYRIHYAPGVDWQGDNVVFFFTDGPEYDKRAAQPATEIADMGPRFKILAAQEAGSVPLRRVSYSGGFDVLAAGEARFQQVLHQGGLPLASLTWPGVKQPTRFVIEALDAGCPFPNGYIAAMHHDADIDRTSGQPFNAPSITLDEARLSSGEVFINGQHDPASRPKPVARTYVDVTPGPKPQMDFLATFDEGAPWGPFTKYQDNNGFIFRNEDWAVDTTGCTENFTFGPLLGQFVLGFADGGSSCNVSITPRKVPTKIAGDRFLHVRMMSDVPSTGRRYPQIMVTNVAMKPDPTPGSGNVYEVPVHSRLGAFPFDLVGPDKVAGTADDLPPDGRTVDRRAAVRRLSGDADRVLRHARLGRQPAVRPRQRLRLPRGRLHGHLEATVDACPRAGRRRGLRPARAVGRLHVDLAGVRVHGRQAFGVRRVARGAHAGRRRHRRLPRRPLPLRHRRDGHPRRHGPQVRAQLQHLPQRPPHGRLRHRSVDRGPRVGRDGAALRDEVVWRLVSSGGDARSLSASRSPR